MGVLYNENKSIVCTREVYFSVNLDENDIKPNKDQGPVVPLLVPKKYVFWMVMLGYFKQI